MGTMASLFIFLLLLGTLSVIPIGLGWTARWGLSGWSDGTRISGACLVSLLFIAPLLPTPPDTAAKASAARTEGVGAPRQRALTRTEKLANIQIEHVLWKKDGFGSVMVATF